MIAETYIALGQYALEVYTPTNALLGLPLSEELDISANLGDFFGKRLNSGHIPRVLRASGAGRWPFVGGEREEVVEAWESYTVATCSKVGLAPP